VKERMDRLPKWAQDKIGLLERDLRQTTKERDELRTKEFGGSGAVVVQEYGFGEHPDTFLPDRARIRFAFDGKCPFSKEKWIECWRGEDRVYVMASHYPLVVYPRASNTLELRVADD
jgi:hypothetical protein